MQRTFLSDASSRPPEVRMTSRVSHGEQNPKQPLAHGGEGFGCSRRLQTPLTRSIGITQTFRRLQERQLQHFARRGAKERRWRGLCAPWKIVNTSHTEARNHGGFYPLAPVGVGWKLKKALGTALARLCSCSSCSFRDSASPWSWRSSDARRTLARSISSRLCVKRVAVAVLSASAAFRDSASPCAGSLRSSSPTDPSNSCMTRAREPLFLKLLQFP